MQLQSLYRHALDNFIFKAGAPPVRVSTNPLKIYVAGQLYAGENAYRELRDAITNSYWQLYRNRQSQSDYIPVNVLPPNWLKSLITALNTAPPYVAGQNLNEYKTAIVNSAVSIAISDAGNALIQLNTLEELPFFTDYQLPQNLM